MMTSLSTREERGAASGTLPAVLRARPGPAREGEPVSVGIPFPRGQARSLSGLCVAGAAGRRLASQWQVLSTWPDGSARWALLDFLAAAEEGVEPAFRVVEGEERIPPGPRVAVEEREEHLRVDAGSRVFLVSRRRFRVEAALDPTDASAAAVIDAELDLPGGRCALPVDELRVEARGPVRATVLLQGRIPAGRGRRAFEYGARVSFFAGTGLVRTELTLRNPHAARHPGGLWDLGDAGSMYLRGLSIAVRTAGQPAEAIEWTAEPGAPVRSCRGGPFEILQASSGGESWRSRNHVDRHGNVALPFRGYRARSAGEAFEGLRASPAASLVHPRWRLSGAVERFWEQFPKAIEADGRSIHLRLFPAREGELHELQGGEQKTHAALFLFEGEAGGRRERPLEWVHSPLRLTLDPEYVAGTGVLPRLLPASDDPHREHLALLESCVEGPSSFFAKREVIDEYGWRHFGDVYGDHENQHAQDPRPVVSHYNNQYDLVHGLLVQFARTADPRWFELARDLALHVIDIDIYHTREDKPAYSGGLFWHTDHYVGAHRSTHRTYSKESPKARRGAAYGGGPSNEHNYASGLLLFHHMTGNAAAREAALGLARWVLDMDDGAKTALGPLDPGPTGCASSTFSSIYHGPGRGAGNSVSVLLDAFELTRDRVYLEKAEELIRRCIHPADDIPARDLGNPEARWSYLVFLQALGKYLDLKAERGERDASFAYARASLAAYARWMLENEVPYARVLDRVEYPTETWPAHDVRKSAVLDLAAVYGDPELRGRFLEKAAFFFSEALSGLSAFETRTCTRPLAILLQSGWTRAAFAKQPPPPEGPLPAGLDFGRPLPFKPQKVRVRRLIATPRGILRLAALLARPSSIARIARAALGRRPT